MNNKKNSSKMFYYILIAFFLILIIFSFTNTDNNKNKKTYSEAVTYFENNQIEKWYVIGNSKIVFLLTDDAGSKVADGDFPKKYDFYINYTPTNLKLLLENEAYTDLYYDSEPVSASIWETLYPIVMIILALVFIYLLFRMFSGKGNGALLFGKSRARTVTNIKVKFEDIAGADEEKNELMEIVEFLKNPTKFTNLGARIPKGILLVGPPGTGKTLLARAVAGESGVPFLQISGSDFVEMYVGVGASRVRDLFEQAKNSAPCIIFIDEIDAVGRQRGAGLGGSNDEREQTLNQLLVELDGFEANQGIIVLAATNRSDVLDPALLRPGRFDRRIYVNPPDIRGREGILRIHAKNKPLAKDINFKTLAKITSGLTGADIENMLNEAAILAARAGRTRILMQDITEGINKVMMGPQKKSAVVTEKDRKITAYHEAGHAILNLKLPNCDGVQEISIIPRGMAGGYTTSGISDDEKHYFTAKLNDLIASCMGGRIAEELIFNDITTGASNDIEKATSIARKMVTEWGMTKKFGFMGFGSEGQVFIGRDYQNKNQYSEKMAGEIDKEIQDILVYNYNRAKDIIIQNQTLLHDIVKLLLARETIYKESLDMLLAGKSIEEILTQLDEEDKNREKTEKKEKKLLQEEQKLKEYEIKVKTSEVFLKHGIITEKEHLELVKLRDTLKNELEEKRKKQKTKNTTNLTTNKTTQKKNTTNLITKKSTQKKNTTIKTTDKKEKKESKNIKFENNGDKDNE